MANENETETFAPDIDIDAQHKAVLDAADINLKTVRDQVGSIADSNKSVGKLVELLAAADREIDRLRGA